MKSLILLLFVFVSCGNNGNDEPKQKWVQMPIVYDTIYTHQDSVNFLQAIADDSLIVRIGDSPDSPVSVHKKYLPYPLIVDSAMEAGIKAFYDAEMGEPDTIYVPVDTIMVLKGRGSTGKPPIGIGITNSRTNNQE